MRAGMAFALFYTMERIRQISGGLAPALLLALHATLLTSGPACAVTAQQLGAVAEHYAREALAASRFPVHVNADRIDARLTLPDCTAATLARLPPGSQWAPRTLVQLRCDGVARWTVLIPISIESEVPVLVLRAACPRGAALREAEVIRDIRRVPGTSADYVNSTDGLLRHHLRRNLGAGSVLTAFDLEADALVRRGQTVNVIAEVAGMRIQIEALALADAHAGERLRLQNLSSFKTIEGVVDIEGAVHVAL